MKITVAGIGYVGLSNAILLSYSNEVKAFDIDIKKVAQVNNKTSPLKDRDIENALKKDDLDLRATSDNNEAFKNPDYIIIATPTDYDPKSDKFNTSSIESVIKNALDVSKDQCFIIRSTIPIGFTKKMIKKFNHSRIYFCPEFLREGLALVDSFSPSRVILGDENADTRKFANLIRENTKLENYPEIFMRSDEAESVKLFANSYLAMRVAFFNELDSFCITNKLSSKNIIKGISCDHRIGNYYNNPSFGYGGYCLPKDTKQLKSNFKNTPNSLIKAIIESNKIRKDFITNQILSVNPKKIGIYRLIMKSDSDNFRSSAIMDIIQKLRLKKLQMLIYEPLFKEDNLEDIPIEKDLEKFKKSCDVIIANRQEIEIKDVSNKVFTRDIFNGDL
tara:strand:- start:29 stop:1198 length:1170 start_codon:yes stop_codon:yes gene_type:complete